MKTIKLLFLVIMISAYSVTTYAGGKYGLRAGYQASNIYNNGSSFNSNTLNAFYVGMFAEQRIVPMLFFGSGSEYSQVGTMENNDMKSMLHYVSIPTYLKLKVGPVYAIGGAAASFKVYEKHYYKDIPQDPYANAGWFDIPVYAGVGIQILVFRIEARYNWGTFDLYSAPNDGYKSQYLQFGVAIAL